MGFLKLLLYAGLIFIATILCVNGDDTGSNSSGTIDFCSLGDIIPIHYDIHVTLLEGNDFIFYTESNISIKICRTMLDIALHSLGHDINKQKLTLTNNDGTIYESTNHTYHTSITVFKFANKISPGFYTLHIEYIDTANAQIYYNKGLYTDKEGYTAYFANSFVSISVRRDLRCFDDPVLKPTFNIVVEQHYQQYNVLSNMPIREQDVMLTHFYTTPHMSICTAMFMLLNFERVPNANGTVNMWCRTNFTSQVKFAQYIAEKVAQEMVRYTNIYSKIPKTDHVAIPNLSVKSYSSWGLIAYNEGNITYNNDVHPITHKMHVAKLIAYEMIQQWFGNLVTPSNSSDIWLSEGFASFLQAYILNKIFEKWRTMDFLVIDSLHGSLRTDSLSLMTSLKAREQMLPDDNTVASAFYDKAPVILRMLQHITTEEVFRKGVIKYLRTHQFKSASSDDLWAIMQTALNESYVPHKDFKVKEVMDPWINQAHYPLVTATRNDETSEVTISQQNLCLQKDNKNDTIYDTKWWIPITYTTQTNPDFTNTALNFRWLNPKDESISFQINPNDWIILNLQQTGYYRVNYDNMNWLKIASYLNSKEYKKIHVLNRAQLIDDSFNLMYYDKLKPEIFFNISSYLWRETDYIAWYPMFQILSKLQKFFGLPESETFKSHIAGTFDALLENVGYEDIYNEDDVTRLKRLDATYWACTVGNALCLKTATIELEKQLSYYYKSKLSPYWYQWIYCFGLKTASIHTWGRVWQLYQEIREQKLLEFLACSEHPYIISKYLNILSSNYSTLQEAEREIVFHNIITKHTWNDDILDFILDNFMTLKPKSISSCDALSEIISNTYSEVQLSKIRNSGRTFVNVRCMKNVMKERISYIKNLLNEYSGRIMKLELQIQSK